MIEANDTCLHVTGFPPDQVLGRRFWETPWFDRFSMAQERLRGGFAEVFGGGRPVTGEVEFAMADGTSRVASFAITGLKDDAGGVASVIVEGEDITERKRAEEALRESEGRFRGTFENAAVGIANADRDGRILRVNDTFCGIVGYPREELLAKTFRDFTHPEDLPATVDQFERLWRGEFPSFSREKRYLRKDGSPVWVDKTVSLHRDAAGIPAYVIAIIEDITDRKRLEAELRAAKEEAEAANRSKDEFLANVSHEIRTPFGSILGMTELVLKTPLTEDQRQCLETARSAADSLLGILNDLLDFAKIESGMLELDPTSFSLRAAVGETMRALAMRAHEKGLELAYDAHPDVPDDLIGDAGRLRQVLFNLVGNAIKFTEVGEVVVRVDLDGDLAPDGDVALRFTVRDTGIGIPPDKQMRIFRAFEQVDTSTTRRYGGTGLGLSIANRLADLMGGNIALESEPGRGSTFTFTARFGRPTTPPGSAEARPPAELLDLPVLVVDDNTTSRRILEESLHGRGIEVAAVGDAAAAIDALLQGVDRRRPHALVLLDAAIPDADGLTLAARIRRRPELSDMRIILLTSWNRPGDQARIRELHIDATLRKPVARDELFETIARVMSLAEGTSPEGEPAGEPAPAVTPLRILVAKDNEFNSRHLERLLGRQGHHVRVVGNGREALASVGEAAFDVLLLDVHTPEMDGIQVIRAIRDRERVTGGHLPVIALTARSRSEDRERCLAAGMDEYLAKPVRASELFAVIDRVKAGGRAGLPDEPA